MIATNCFALHMSRSSKSKESNGEDVAEGSLQDCSYRQQGQGPHPTYYDKRWESISVPNRPESQIGQLGKQARSLLMIPDWSSHSHLFKPFAAVTFSSIYGAE